MADQKAKEMEPVETQIVEIMPPDIENLIYVIRNKQVMVDSDLAMLYQVETKALNRAVKIPQEVKGRTTCIVVLPFFLH